jgi:hypothetical protein
MKKIALTSFLLAFIFISNQMIQSQDAPIHVYPQFGLSLGFFYPSDVNDYMKTSMPSTYTVELGTQDMFMYFEILGGVTLRLKKVDITPSLEYAIAPKFISVTNGDDYSFNFSRISPGVSANYYIPVGSGKHALFLGGGVQYHILHFEDFSASNPGFKLQAGISFQFGKMNVQPYGAFKYAKATDSSEEEWPDFNLNYTGGQIGVLLSFHPVISYK